MLLLSHYMLYNTLRWIMWYTIHLCPISFQFHCIFGILQSFSISSQSDVSCWPVAIESLVAMVQFYGWCELINGLCEFTIISFNSGRFLWWLLMLLLLLLLRRWLLLSVLFSGIIHNTDVTMTMLSHLIQQWTTSIIMIKLMMMVL